MILIINTCKEKLHYYEFVQPIEDILKNVGEKFFTRHHTKVKKGDLTNAKKIIISGTSIQDNDYLHKNTLFSNYLREEKQTKPILGICAGMQMIGLASEIKKQSKKPVIGKTARDVIKEKTEIGYYKETFKKEFLGKQGEQEVYHLHTNYIDFKQLPTFEIYAGTNIPQAVKHKEKPLYGVLFHPEVRNKEMITNFVKHG